MDTTEVKEMVRNWYGSGAAGIDADLALFLEVSAL